MPASKRIRGLGLGAIPPSSIVADLHRCSRPCPSTWMSYSAGSPLASRPLPQTMPPYSRVPGRATTTSGRCGTRLGARTIAGIGMGTSRLAVVRGGQVPRGLCPPDPVLPRLVPPIEARLAFGGLGLYRMSDALGAMLRGSDPRAARSPNTPRSTRRSAAPASACCLSRPAGAGSSAASLQFRRVQFPVANDDAVARDCRTVSSSLATAASPER